MAREPVTDDVLDDFMNVDLSADPGVIRERAEQYLAWADDPHADDVFGVADFLSCAAEYLELAGETDRALATYARAAEVFDQRVMPSAHVWWSALLFHLEREDEALAVANDLRKRRSESLHDYVEMGGVLEDEGHDKLALGWYTRGILLAESLGLDGSLDTDALFIRRLGLRQSLGMPIDEDDEWGLHLLAEQEEDEDLDEDGFEPEETDE